jgi:hypothetical protein
MTSDIKLQVLAVALAAGWLLYPGFYAGAWYMPRAKAVAVV